MDHEVSSQTLTRRRVSKIRAGLESCDLTLVQRSESFKNVERLLERWDLRGTPDAALLRNLNRFLSLSLFFFFECLLLELLKRASCVSRERKACPKSFVKVRVLGQVPFGALFF